MTPNEYKIKHSTEWKTFLMTEAGLNLMTVLSKARPVFDTSLPHKHHESSGAVRGHQDMINTMIYLTTPPPVANEVEMDYGVKEKKQE